MIRNRSGQPDNSIFLQGLFVLALLVLSVGTTLADTTARTLRLLRPLNGATVRESVPIRIAPADLPEDGYVTVAIDKTFRTAKVIDPGSSLIYVWDTQAPYQDPNNPGVDKYTEDGDHEIEVGVYDRQGTLLAQGAATVRLANKVTNLPDGIKLSYNWSENETLRYKRHSELNSLSTTGATTPSNVETADIRFSRSIEDATGGEYLVRDEVYPDGLIVRGGTTNVVQNLFNLKSRYRTVNSYGEVLVEETPFSAGDHLGFPIVQVPDRRITVGDSWDAKIEFSVPWATEKPTVVTGSGRLDGFEWQNGYPTAKIIETYDGPATVFADTRGTESFQADNVHLVRTYWFAYNSKRLVKSRTEITIDANVTSDISSALSSGTQAGGSGFTGPGGGPTIPNPYGGGDDGQQQPQIGQVGGVGGTSSTTPIKLQILDELTLVGV